MRPTPEILTDRQVGLITDLINFGGLDDAVIAERFGVPVHAIRAIRKGRDYDRSTRFHDAGLNRRVRVSEIARITGLTRPAILKRLRKGVTGLDLLAARHTLPRISPKTKRLMDHPPDGWEFRTREGPSREQILKEMGLRVREKRE